MKVRRSNNGAGFAASVSDDQPRRCAIYTRKSSSEGLEQEFNSLDAQREACLAYIRHQPGWVALPARYDDGGFTGANVERPAFQQLLADVAAGQVDIIVCYKIDRLSRSLVDFTKLIERLDASGASFVSVTQNFSTATAMGRFTLNILMSFAEFEREMIRERTRDKLAAAKRAGHWIGGTAPLGYATVNGKLAIHEGEAPVVREIFELYGQLRSGIEIARILNGRAAPTKRERIVNGRARTARPWSSADVCRVLRCQLYIGQVSLGSEARPNNHPAIIDRGVFEATQELLRAGCARRKAAVHNPAYLLSGVVFCACGARCTTASATKNRICRRYYRCATRLKLGASACTGRMIPAIGIEEFVLGRIRDLLATGALAASISAMVPERFATERAKLQLVRTQLPAHIAALSASVQRYVESLDHLTGPVRRSLEARLQDASDERERAEARLRVVDRQLYHLDAAEADVGWLADCFAHFDRLWGFLTPLDQGRLVRAVIERVESDEDTNHVRVRFVDLGDLLDTRRESAYQASSAADAAEMEGAS